MPKTLIFCFGGSGNDPGDAGHWDRPVGIDHMLRLQLRFGGMPDNSGEPIVNAHGEQQRSFYYAGIGCYGGWFSRAWNFALAPRGGDTEAILRRATADLRRHWAPGDRLLLFGYSRGAMLAQRLLRHCAEQTPQFAGGLAVDFLGLFDTVLTEGGRLLSFRWSPEQADRVLDSRVRWAVQLLALDEPSPLFRPTLLARDRRCLQLWLPGTHLEIGGKSRNPPLSAIGLDCMLEQLRSRFANTLKILDPAEIDYRAPALRAHGIAVADVETARAVPLSRRGKWWWLIRLATLLGRPRRLPADAGPPASSPLALLDATVAERFARVADYRPAPLRGRWYRIRAPDGQLSEPRQGIQGLRSPQRGAS